MLNAIPTNINYSIKKNPLVSHIHIVAAVTALVTIVIRFFALLRHVTKVVINRDAYHGAVSFTLVILPEGVTIGDVAPSVRL